MVSNKTATEQALIITPGNIYISIYGIYLSYVLKTLNKLTHWILNKPMKEILLSSPILQTKKLSLKDFKSLDWNFKIVKL